MATSNYKERRRVKAEIKKVGDGFYLGTEALAKMLGVSRRTLNDQFSKGLIVGSFRIGDRYRISLVDAIRNWPSLMQVGGPLRDFAERNGLVERIPDAGTLGAMEVGG